MTRIIASTEFVQPGLVGGAEQAVQYTTTGLLAALGPDDTLAVVGSPSLPLPTQIERIRPPRPARPRFVQETLTFAELRNECDVYYLPNYFTPPVRSRCRVVTNIYDQQFRHRPQHFSRRKRIWMSAAHRWTLRRADVVTVISDWVRGDLIATYGERVAPKLHVVPIPVDWSLFDTPAEPTVERPYVLAVASHYSHKNLVTLVRAFRRVRDRVPDVQLVLVGQLGHRVVGVRTFDDIPRLVGELGLDDDVLVTGFVPQPQLASLYAHAELFVFPSLFEGFGLPPVEALGVGLPVITTRCTAVPEATLGLAEYVDDPLDDGELAARIVSRLHSGARRDDDVAARIREHYAPGRIGGLLYEVMTSPT